MNFLNGHKKVIGWSAAVGAVVGVLSWLGGVYEGWSSRVEAAVIEQRMVNEDDAALKAMVPRVERAEWQIEQDRKDISALTANSTRADARMDELRELVYRYIKEQMREGTVPR